MDEAKILKSKDEGGLDLMLAEHAHELAMSDDPVVAVRGRYMKECSPAFMRWLFAEIERATAPDALLLGFAQALTNEIVSLTINLASDDEARRTGAKLAVLLIGRCIKQATSGDAIAKAGLMEGDAP